MKRLQNNYTTKEQSKRLLELGVPADSADCVAHIVDNSIDLYEYFYLKGDARISVINQRHTYTKVTTLKDNKAWLDEPYPCWSVGRLIEIYELCFVMFDDYNYSPYTTLVERVIEYIEDAIKENKLDFSKLED